MGLHNTTFVLASGLLLDSRESSHEVLNLRVIMSKFLTAVLLLLATSSAFAVSGETHPIPLMDRLKWDLWAQGLEEYEQAPKLEQKQQVPDDIERVLRKYNL